MFFKKKIDILVSVTRRKPHCLFLIEHQEYVASLIGLYKNSGAVLCVAINFLLIWSLYLAITQLM